MLGFNHTRLSSPRLSPCIRPPGSCCRSYPSEWLCSTRPCSPRPDTTSSTACMLRSPHTATQITASGRQLNCSRRSPSEKPSRVPTESNDGQARSVSCGGNTRRAMRAVDGPHRIERSGSCRDANIKQLEGAAQPRPAQSQIWIGVAPGFEATLEFVKREIGV